MLAIYSHTLFYPQTKEEKIMRKFFVALCLAAFCTVNFVGCNPPKKEEGSTPAATTTSAEEAPASDAAAE